MSKRKFEHIFFLLLSCLACLSSCRTKEKNRVSYKSIDTLLIDTTIFHHPLQVPINRASLDYVKLETGRQSAINHIDQLAVCDSTIFILDRFSNALILFDISGKFIKRVSVKKAKFQCFDVFDNSVYVLDKNQSKIFKFDLKANLLKTFDPGFHGVQFAALPDGKFIYNTCGLTTRDGDSENSQLSIVSGSKGNVQLPFKSVYSGVRYFFENQFSRNSDQLFFTSAFDNVLYKIDTSKITALTKFDFGQHNMPDSIFVKGQTYDNFNAFPFVSDLVNVVNTSRFSFFKFSYHNQQGYMIIDAKRKRIIAGGINIAADEASDFNNAFPVYSYGDKLVAIVSPRTWLKMPAQVDISNTRLNKKYPIKTIHADDAPILLFYTLL